MSDKPMTNTSQSDWERVDAMEDEDIDTSDIPPLTDAFFKRAKLRMPRQRVTATLQIDADVLDWFKAQGDDYEQRLNAALRIYAEAHKAARR
ncbi:MAG TPA: BrnA antitoxin family protein [Roseiflexaceae bacterium]|jgi:uncharacterized protein (DUF4415 family)|nr:BrnA antitoxin family protein [Roseiflexaceae bacterium]